MLIDKIMRDIHALEELSLEDLRTIFNALGSKMTEQKFSSTCVNALDEIADFICGELV